MELDINALDMLPATGESQLWPCAPTCNPYTCGDASTCWITDI
ncbi:hypothetical protein Pth03_26880 [Planotetraspora thailandica]|uniref:Uncharacterized protein n=1 Tax=Planotetraspora thailandica TaxID=487172 RepID=A0A8J3V5C5_9ACTN|nr:ALQxL family class IV lanthipeptide [Planotetraspora thailandica]GII54299.1 hypothetical protein Pth03_26880 [Planotetraspora thailandica]